MNTWKTRVQSFIAFYKSHQSFTFSQSPVRQMRGLLWARSYFEWEDQAAIDHNLIVLRSVQELMAPFLGASIYQTLGVHHNLNSWGKKKRKEKE